MSFRSSQQMEHLGYSLLESVHLQSSSVILTSGSFSITSLLAGGVPERPRSISLRRRMCYIMLSLSKRDLKFKSKFPKNPPRPWSADGEEKRMAGPWPLGIIKMLFS